MRPDVIDLYRFYRSPLGEMTRDFVMLRIRNIWAHCRGQRVLGIGYTIPFLDLLREETRSAVALMPASQGVIHWPDHEKSCTLSSDEAVMPFPDAVFDRIIMAHSLENANHTQQLLREVWRVLAPTGRLLVIVPNRNSMWSRLERTPFGHGKPYTLEQLTKQLCATMFQPTNRTTAMFVPPFQWQLSMKLAPHIETLGYRLLSGIGGILIIEATKQIYSISDDHSAQRKLRRALNPVMTLNHAQQNSKPTK